jgi:hypothetical protein
LLIDLALQRAEDLKSFPASTEKTGVYISTAYTLD